MATLEDQSIDKPFRMKIKTNAELVAQRLQASREIQQARQLSKQRTTERNQRVREILEKGSSATESTNYTVPPLFAVKVSVCDKLRKELKLSGREKRGRVFLEQSSDAVSSLRALKYELHAFFRALRKDTFLLQAGYPTLVADGAVVTPTDGADTQFWNIESDEDVIKTFVAATQFFERQQQQETNNVLKRPSIVIHVKRNPNAPQPPPPPAYLENMANPKDTETMTMLSFYSFPPNGIEDPEAFAKVLRKKWKPFGALGRVYVATEGTNAQMSIPTNVLQNFMECCESTEELGAYMENGINIDPLPLSMEEFSRAGTQAEGGAVPQPPFRGLHIRVRGKIVADGLDHGLDWRSAGYDMPPLEWHEALKKIKQQHEQIEESAESAPIILDCRNSYETDVGIFEGAEPLGTENFRESWDALKDRLQDTPKDAPIMTYCTGGIRCVKVGAYLTQEMGFTNVSRLAGGIIAYDRKLREAQKAPEKNESEPSMFKGINFVFDGRLGRPITEDAMGVCVTCGSETSLVSNCRNGNCHKRMIQCESCKTTFHGTCSEACRHRVLHGELVTGSQRQEVDGQESSQAETFGSYVSLDTYSAGHSTPPPSMYRELDFNTKALIPSGSHMVSGESQGRLLKQFASMTRHGRALEIGTFTAYATSCLLEGVLNVADTREASESSEPSYVMTMERDSKAYDVAVAHMKIVSEHGFGEEAAEALCAIRAAVNEHNPQTVPVVDEKVTKLSIQSQSGNNVGCDLIHVSDALATLEEMAAGKGEFVPETPFDVVFVDADKTRLVEYANACLSSDLILRKGGLILVDNVLWKGLVLEASGGGSPDDEASLSSASASIDKDEKDAIELRKNRRARKLANKMHRFNSAIAQDDRAEVLMLPLRDGLSVIRKK